MKQKITFVDFAHKTGFSKTTISRYFNHAHSLSPETQKIIRKLLKNLDHRYDHAGQKKEIFVSNEWDCLCVGWIGCR